AIIAALTVFYYAWKDWFPWFWDFFIFEYRNDIVGGLFLIPFIYASLVFWWRGSVVVWLLSAAAMLPCVIYYSFSVVSLARNIALSLVPLMVVVTISLELQWRETQRKISAEREKERQVYMSQVFKAQEDERQRVAQELHNGTMQELIVVANRAQKLASGRIPTTPEAREYGKSIKDIVLRVSEEIRRLSRDLRPSILDNVGLLPAIRWLTDRLNEEEMINGNVVIKGVERGFSSESEVTIFRIVQEALNNVRRHSQATHVLITVEFSPKSVKIVVSDNGKGFILNKTVGDLAAEGKLGIIGMQQRAKFLNGNFDIYSEPGKGTSVSIEIVD
ncbi:MAG: sensor histidine kinase, partial [Dehalococcoidales bacterium]